MSPTGFIDHIGVGVPDLAAAKRYYDELMPIVGLRAWFPTTQAGEFNYGPDGAAGPQIFFYQALEPGPHSRHGTGLQHLSFMVPDRAIVREAHDWAVAARVTDLKVTRHPPPRRAITGPPRPSWPADARAGATTGSSPSAG
jgi:catechol 2,3-dioxygenase-like lactoylglutathione lyase family enzyme